MLQNCKPIAVKLEAFKDDETVTFIYFFLLLLLFYLQWILISKDY